VARLLLKFGKTMSRIGNLPVSIPSGVTVTVDKRLVTVTGPKGTLTLPVPQKITVEVKDNQVIVGRLSEDKKIKANHGTTRAHLNNMIKGVVTPWTKQMEIRGTGYKFAVNGNKLIVTAGFINPREVIAPEGISFQLDDETKLTISGINKVIVGQIASNIRKIRKPEPYKGKGIRYLNEFIKLKAGKTAKA
jgi:large subunit ribosomal protein L6